MQAPARRSVGAFLGLAVALLGAPQAARAICLQPPGDVTADALTNVIDVQCNILMNLWSLAGQTGPVPTCVLAPGSPAVVADHNCDGILNVLDTLLGVNFALKITLIASIDGNANQCVDACESDLDGDGDFDLADCAPLDPGISVATAEQCNGFDDNCDGKIDEATAASVAASCSDQDACNGAEVCSPLPGNLALMISELMIAPAAVDDAAGEWVELFNPTAIPININGYILTNEAGQSHTINPGGALFVPPRGFVVLARNANPAQNGGVLANYAYAGFTMPDAGGVVTLLNAALAQVDRVQYTSGAFPVINSRSMALVDPRLDNALASSWAASSLPIPSGDKGTPRGPNRDVQASFCSAGVPPVCTDSNPCTDNACQPASGCVATNNTAPCSDGNACTLADACGNGACQPGPAAVCDDGNPCTSDSCEPATGCVATNTTAPCSDGNACTQGDACAGGQCISGAPVSCNDGNPCTDDSCAPATGCVATPNGAPCSDGNACTVGDICASGACQAGSPLACDDANPCTIDACAPSSGCTTAPAVGSCDDGNACTVGEACNDGQCAGGTALSCDDGDPCTADSCVPTSGCQHSAVLGGACAPLPEAAFCGVVGNVGQTVRCTLRVARLSAPTPPPAAMSFHVTYDASAVKALRFVDDVCIMPGLCLPATVPPSAIDPSGHTLVPTPPDVAIWAGSGAATLFHPTQPSTSLTEAYVDAGSVLGDSALVDLEVELMAATPPSDPAFLYLSDIIGATADAAKMTGTVMGGVMVLGLESCVDLPALCDDEDACTTDSCNATTGSCTHIPLECDDGDACNGGETCSSLSGCQAGTAPNCNDGLVCTVDACEPIDGCTHHPLSCTDGNPCNGTESCHPQFGCQAGPAPICDDVDPCTIDLCDPAQGCIHTPSPAANCLPPGLFCGVSGAKGQIVECPIRIARANANTPAPASAQFSIEVEPTFVRPLELLDELCLGAFGAPPCIEAATPPAVLMPTGHTVVTIPQDVSSWWDSGHVVVFHPESPNLALSTAYVHQGTVLGQPEILRLRVQLVADIPAATPTYLAFSAMKAATATAAAMTGTVMDGTIVYALDSCTGVAGACDDGNACTADDCTSGVCVYSNVICSDANACNGVETCDLLHGCQPTAALDCSDGNACTDDSCLPNSGCVHIPVECSDGNACNGVETCHPTNGCAPGPSPQCNDSNPCTVDSCAAALGCLHAPLSTPACLPDGVLCYVSGAAGSDATCTLRLARASAATPPPASAQFNLGYAADRLGPPAFEDELCLGVGGGQPCMAIPTPPATLSPSGHTVTLVPSNPASWNGNGSVVLFHPASPSTPLTPAVWSGGQVQGDAAFMTVRFELLEEIPAHDPVPVTLAQVKGATGLAAAMVGTISSGVMVLSLQSCAGAPGVCDDGYPCTVDACELATGACTHAPKQCSDGNTCNGEELCQPSTGLCLPAFPLDCNDGDACTVDSCAPLAGCIHTPLGCDDGNPCNGLESCQSSSGCTAGMAPSCSDGDPCTIDTCTSSAGCAHTPDVASGCLPLGALCAISGGAGETVECTLHMARANALTPSPASAQFRLTYDAGELAFQGLVDAVCFGDESAPTCVDVGVPPGTLSPSGHTVVLVPQGATSWAGQGNVVLFHSGAPSTALTTAIWAASGPPPESALARARFLLAADIDPATPTYVGLDQVKGATAQALAMTGSVMQGVMIMSLSSCSGQPALCNDGDLCTMDACDASTGTCTHSPLLCDDANACNGIESCAPASGCVAGIPLSCNDANACTADACEPTTGCVHSPAPCDDGDACNGVEACEESTGCEPGLAPDCDDADPCTDDGCSPSLGCIHAPMICADADVCNGFELCALGVGCTPGAPLDCDDGNACTTDSCDPALGCRHTPGLTPDCLPPGAVCGLVGTAGMQLDCLLLLARASQATPMPTSAQFTLTYDAAMAEAAGFWDELCLVPGEPCIELGVPPAVLYPSGHTVVAIPAAPASWAGQVNAVLFHPAAPSTALTPAYVSADQVTGDAALMWLRLTLAADVPAHTPVYVYASSIKGATGQAEPLSGWVHHGAMVLGLTDCTAAPGSCDDGNACTFDTCDAATGSCTHLALDCSDGDVCNGLETCEAASGDCLAGVSLSCDDGEPCTVDSCAPDFGCLYIPLECDDGDPCNGAESCVAGVCEDGQVPSCNDENACTIDQCIPGTGCSHAPSVDDACLPPGVLCGLAGQAGSTATCSLRMARHNAATPEVTSAQLALSWDPTRANAQAFTDTVCTGPNGEPPCIPIDTPPSTLDPTGHIVVLVPSQLGNWQGNGSLVFFQPPGAGGPLTPAYLQQGGVVGDPQVLDLHLTLAVDIPPTAPLWVSAHSIKGSTGDAQKLNGWASQGLIVFALASCSGAPGVCDDEEPCTVDACVGGQCTHAPVSCDDGSVCTGAESCVSGVGCIPGALADCDDGTACTADSCHPLWGCVHTLLVCDDGDICTGAESCDPLLGCVSGPTVDCDDDNACTDEWCEPDSGCWSIPVVCQDGDACNGMELCNPASGCLPALAPLSCDDGNSCTLDSCSAANGCIHAPSLVAECLPDGACCGFAGASGDEQTCALRVAASDASQPFAASLQVTFAYSPDSLLIAGFTDEVCFGGGGEPPCLDSAVPPGTLFPTGHSVTLVPGDISTWVEQGSLVLFHATAPATPISTAVGSPSGVQGTAEVLAIHVELADDVPPTSPAYLWCTDIKGGTATAQKLHGQAQQGTLLFSQ